MILYPRHEKVCYNITSRKVTIHTTYWKYENSMVWTRKKGKWKICSFCEFITVPGMMSVGWRLVNQWWEDLGNEKVGILYNSIVTGNHFSLTARKSKGTILILFQVWSTLLDPFLSNWWTEHLMVLFVSRYRIVVIARPWDFLFNSDQHSRSH